MTAYYNEINPYAAQWLRNLIAAGHIARGDVDERSIEDVKPDDLRNYTQCHFFAGIGVWSYALRRAGWPDDRPVWTGSCPCQPFSAAGKGAGFADPRHLWPDFAWLIRQCRPVVIFGEQVASKDGLAWLDIVQADLEAEVYAVGTGDYCAAGVGAPHVRQRLYFAAKGMADNIRPGLGTQSGKRNEPPTPVWPQTNDAGSCVRTSGLANAKGEHIRPGLCDRGTAEQRRNISADSSVPEWVADSHIRQQRQGGQSGICTEYEACGRNENTAAATGFCSDLRPGPVDGFWRDADWLFCRDGKWRPVEPGIVQMVDGSASSLGRLRPEDITGVEQSVANWEKRHSANGTKGLRDLWDALSSQEASRRSTGRFNSVQEAPFLLAYLRQLSDQGWRFEIGHERTSSEASRRVLRVLRYIDETDNSPHQRGLDEQFDGKSPDTLRQLSQILAYHTEKCWGSSCGGNAGAFPLENNAPSRVGRLRAYGNAINAELEAEFIRAFKDCEDEIS
jgi:site-specific DNA-cytosine methylase